MKYSYMDIVLFKRSTTNKYMNAVKSLPKINPCKKQRKHTHATSKASNYM